MNEENRTEEPCQQVYETPDLNLASFLRCRSFNITDFKRNAGRTIFVFHDSPELRRAVLDYANDRVVPVRTFCNTLRDLRAITR